MNNKKHQEYIDEMMVVFGGEKNADTPAAEPISTEPEYNAVDSFSDMANDMLQNFTSTLTGGPIGAATHVSMIGDLNNSEQSDDVAGDECPEGECPNNEDPNQTIDPEQDQVMFDLSDDGLVIKFSDTELHLSSDAVSKLKSYLSGSETEEDTDSEETEEKDSDTENED